MNLSEKYTAEVDRITKKEWEAILPEFDDATIYQTWSYGAVRWGVEQLGHAVIKRGDEIVALAQVAIREIPFLKLGVAYVPWGPVWIKKNQEKNPSVFRVILCALRDEYAMRRGLCLRLSPMVYERAENNLEAILNESGYQKIRSVKPYRTFLLDVSRPLDQLRKSLNPKWRNKLNGAERNSLEVVEGDSEELYQCFLSLQREMQTRKAYEPGVDYEEFGRIQSELPDSLKMRIMLCKHNGVPIVVTICSAIGETGIYLLGASGDQGLNLKGSYLLQWRTIQWLKSRGCSWYDLGGINRKKNPGGYDFKAGLSGFEISHLGTFESKNNNISRFFLKGIDWLKASQRSWNKG
jgi:lipid II:glycine glycyltransferase (peptidoglycan interpeptide bridge formation enzyme)